MSKAHKVAIELVAEAIPISSLPGLLRGSVSIDGWRSEDVGNPPKSRLTLQEREPRPCNLLEDHHRVQSSGRRGRSEHTAAASPPADPFWRVQCQCSVLPQLKGVLLMLAEVYLSSKGDRMVCTSWDFSENEAQIEHVMMCWNWTHTNYIHTNIVIFDIYMYIIIRDSM